LKTHDTCRVQTNSSDFIDWSVLFGFVFQHSSIHFSFIFMKTETLHVADDGCYAALRNLFSTLLFMP
jgi:hypothetical protein